MKSSEVKVYTTILVALEGAAESIRNLLREQADRAVMEQTIATLRDPKNTVALQAMVRAAIAGAANALNVDASAPPAPPQPPIPDGWPEGWILMQEVDGFKVRYFPARIVDRVPQHTALRYFDPEDARRDAWERYEQERKA